MGALTSWGMLAFTHHALVQYASLRCGVITKWEFFSAYSLLGDDLVIANERVAKEYSLLMNEIGVPINQYKSLISSSGRASEFAKKTYFNGLDVSAIPVKEIYSGMKGLSNALEIGRKYNITPSVFLRIFGAKYKTLGSILRPFNKMGKK